jgi:hypothetical protein
VRRPLGKAKFVRLFLTTTYRSSAMRGVLQVAVAALLIALAIAALPMPTAINTTVSPVGHTPSNGHGPGRDKNQAHSAQAANGAQAAENAINQILQNRLKNICRGC